MSEEKKFCPNCGFSIKNFEGKFCPNCWHQIKEDLEDESFTEKFKISEENKEKIKEKTEEIAKITAEKSKIVWWKIKTFCGKLKEKIKIYFPIFLDFSKKHKKKIFIISGIILFLAIFYFFIFDKIKPYFSEKNLENNSGAIEEISTWNQEESEETSTWELEWTYAWETEDTFVNSEENTWYIGDNPYYFYKVKSDKAFFYDEFDMSMKNFYVLAWDIVKLNFRMIEWTFDENYTYVSYETNNWKETIGYLKNSDIIPATKEEVEKEIERLEKIREKTSFADTDKENKDFLISHYKDIENKNYYTAFNNYLYPKAKNVDDFAKWYKWVYEINLSEIEKIGENEYKYVVSIYSDSWLNKIETSIKVWKVDWKLKILGYWTKKL